MRCHGTQCWFAVFYDEDWQLAKTPTATRHQDDVLVPIEWAFRNDADADVEQIAKAVFVVLDQELDHGEVRNVASVLPRDMKALWPESARAVVCDAEGLDRSQLKILVPKGSKIFDLDHGLERPIAM